MSRRTAIYFWAALVASVVFLRSAWSAVTRATATPRWFAVATGTIALVGLLTCATVAGRILVVVTRGGRRAKKYV